MRNAKPDKANKENPTWGAAEFAKAEKAADILGELFGKEQADTMLKPKRGRPVADKRKELVSVRYDPEVLEAFRASGPGWQGRLNAALADWLKTHKPEDVAA
ncbi:hypothetical protein D3C76_542360 [compost metagenome]